MDMDIRGKRVLITGGSKGIGLACAQAFAAEGCDVVLASRDPAALASAAAAVRARHNVNVAVFAGDLGDSAARVALHAAHPEIDVLVNNAGAIPGGTVHDISLDRWQQAWALKVFGYIHLTQLYLPGMEAKKDGVIVNIIGMAGERPEPKYIATCCGNAALMMFTQCLGGESMRDGVRIVGVNPGPIMSDRHRRGAERVAERELGSKDRWPELYKRFPIGRPGRVDEVADVVAFLASDHASYISGEIIRIDAGLKVRDPVY
jgi:NAD(P)-dependent dehydrogenase (short-subunit alcohol dehydrogenase family)